MQIVLHHNESEVVNMSPNSWLTGDWSGRLTENESMQQYCYWRVGGRSRWSYHPNCIDDLIQFMGILPSEIPVLWLGLGSNLLIRDGGFSGVVIHTFPALNHIRHEETSTHLDVLAGVPVAKLANYTAKNMLSGCEFMIGIPGSFGGALAMNAGSHGEETWDRVTHIKLLSRTGKVKCYPRSAFTSGYRSIHLIQDPDRELFFLEGTLQLVRDSDNTGKEKIKQHRSYRMLTQPVGLPNCGSTFCNPQKISAGQLIESCGLKGYRIGDAEISSQHANFIINRGNATATDIETLIQHIQDCVRRQHQINLKTEVKIVGNPLGQEQVL